jgi:nucleotide-binding universal stress UspA family protein
MKVIVAIDQSANWKQIVEAITKRRWHRDTSFKVLTVLEPMQWEKSSPVSSEIAHEMALRRQKLASQVLLDARGIIEKNIRDCAVHVEVRTGSPRTEIVDAATDWMADKILIGAHGHSPNRLFSGSVSQAVAQHALCSVELIRLREPPEPSENLPATQATAKSK